VSIAEAEHRPANTGRTVKLWLGFLLVIAAGIGLAWLGAGQLRPQVSDSGLEFRTLKAGTGKVLGPEDAAVLDYVLTTDDGTVVDASDNHGGPQPFSSSMPGLFPGFAEAMGKMQEGGMYRFTMPPHLAFPEGPPQGFPGGSLTFQVRVQKVVRGGAAMLRQMQAAQQQSAAPPQQ